MKIMFCLGSMNKGGAERVVANLANEFIKKYDVDIVITSFQNSAYELNNRINLISLDKNLRKENILVRSYRRIHTLRNILKNEKPDVVISLLPEPTYRLMIAKKFLGIKTIISVRNDPNREYNSFLKKILVRLLFTPANGFIFQTEDSKKWFPKKIQNKSIVIPNPINENFICKPYIGKRKKEIVTVGRLNEQKNHKLLISAFSELVKEYPDYILKIYGEGVLKGDLQKQIDDFGLTNKAFLMGNSDNIKDEIYKSKMFVLSSDYEGMPNALMEAMALGLPCISTDCPIGGPKFLINNKVNGVLTKVSNEDELIEAMKFIIDNDKKSHEISIEANKIGSLLNSKVINKKWEDYIKSILG